MFHPLRLYIISFLMVAMLCSQSNNSVVIHVLFTVTSWPEKIKFCSCVCVNLILKQICYEAPWMWFNVFELPCLAMWCKDGHSASRLLIWHGVYDQWHIVLHSLPIYDSVHHLFTLFNRAKEKVVKWASLFNPEFIRFVKFYNGGLQRINSFIVRLFFLIN